VTPTSPASLFHAVRGALGFLSRLPVGQDERAWQAFRSTPAAFPLAGYAVGTAVALPVAVAAVVTTPVLAPTLAVAFPASVYGVTGIAHLDGLADLGDAAVVHGDANRRLSVARDSQVGVGGALSVALAVVGLALAGLALATLAGGRGGLRAAGIVLAAEVGAKFGVVVVAALGTPSHDGMGARVADGVGIGGTVLPAALSIPAAAATWPAPAAAVALVAGPLSALSVLWWARGRLGGVNGDVFGAANELARLAGLHAGVVAWTLS